MRRYLLIQSTHKRELFAAALYGVLVTLLLGMPSYKDVSQQLETHAESVQQIGFEQLDDVYWSKWHAAEHGTILCPPGQLAYLVKLNENQKELICGYLATRTAKNCQESGNIQYQCQANPDIGSFFTSMGYEKPETFSGCCPKAQMAICRYAGQRLRVHGQLLCRT